MKRDKEVQKAVIKEHSRMADYFNRLKVEREEQEAEEKNEAEEGEIIEMLRNL